MSRGTSVAMQQRQTRVTSPLIGINGTSVRQTRRRGASNQRTGINSTKAKAVQVSRPEPLTLRALRKSLEIWEDPEEEAQTDKAKENIKRCFKEQSEKLDLSSLSLSTLPDVLGRMQQIRILNLSNNLFNKLPDVLGKLTYLKQLHISYNVLTEIPDYVKDLKKLQLLDASCNHLRRVTEELARLPKLEEVLLSHNRIAQFPENIHRIKNLSTEDQLQPASIASFSSAFAAQWEETFKYEPNSWLMELWLARFEEILQSEQASAHRELFQQRIRRLLNSMAKNSHVRQWCYEAAGQVLNTCQDRLVYSLFEMEIKMIVESIIDLELQDEHVRQEVERIFDFYRLQEIALTNTPASNGADVDIEAWEALLFFYVSPENTLTMPLGGEKPTFMCCPHLVRVTDEDVRKAVERIQQEKDSDKDFLINFVSDKDFWRSYLENRYKVIIEEHTNIFFDQLEELEETKEKISEYHYLTQSNRIAEEKDDSEKRLYKQLTNNIIGD